jgi:hypothetical protein
MRRSAGSLSRLLATRAGAVVPANATEQAGVTDIQSEALTRLLTAEEQAYRGKTFRVEGIVTETSGRHADPAHLTLQGHTEGETRHQVRCILGSKERDSLYGVEVGHRVRVLGEYHGREDEPGRVTLASSRLVR